MGLLVTNRVDLSSFKSGDKAPFTLEKGRDNRFRITPSTRRVLKLRFQPEVSP